MYAIVTAVQIQAGKEEEYLRVWREEIQPLVKTFPGFAHAYILFDAAKGQALPITLYQAQADADAVQSSGRFQEVVRKLGGTIVPGSVVRTGYDVVLDVGV